MKKPNSVRYALALIWAEVALEVLLTILDGRVGYLSDQAVVRHLCFALLFCILPYSIGQRNDWARRAYAGWEVTGYCLLVLKHGVATTGLEWHAYWATLPLTAWSIYLLFSAESCTWFQPSQRGITDNGK